MTELREEDLKIQVSRDSAMAGLTVPNNMAQVKITHLPTGKFAVCVHRSALEAKAEALRDLYMLLEEQSD